MIMANVTTPANFFHLLRRQMKWNFRKPLVVFTPKSLLRHSKVVSTKEELAKGSFQEVIDDIMQDKSKVTSLVFCTGKFYYDLLDRREENGRNDVALVRVEQLFPLPQKQLERIIQKYPDVTEYIWAQEEPKNMGAWSYMLMNFNQVKLNLASQRVHSSPAAGSSARSKARHKKVIDMVFETP
jgi:2-oxoglutarate dehydrogenase E1 component